MTCWAPGRPGGGSAGSGLPIWQTRGELGLGHADEGFELIGERDVAFDEVEDVGDGFEGVVDLVGDGAGEVGPRRRVFRDGRVRSRLSFGR